MKSSTFRHRSLLSIILLSIVSQAPVSAQDRQAEDSHNKTPETAPNQARAEPRSARAKKDDVGFRWDDRPSLRFGNGTRVDFHVNFATELHVSTHLADGRNEGVDIARRRVGVSGAVRDLVEYEVDAEVGVGAGAGWRDAYVNYRQFELVRVQAGQFKLPFSLDENTGSANLDFVHRSRAASEIGPGRDPGVMVHGRLLRRIIRYEAGLFRRDGSNARTQNTDRVHGGRTAAGRLTVRPFRRAGSALDDLQFGAAFTRSDLGEGRSDLRGRTGLNVRFFRTNVWVKGERERRGLEARWRPGPFSIRGEWMRVSDERLGQSVEDLDLPPLVGTGWYVSATWLLTGEPKADAIRPRRPLFRGGYGAIEATARIERLAFGSGTDDELASDSPRASTIPPNADRALTIGGNWYPTRWVKVQINIVRDELTNPLQASTPMPPISWSRLLRVQVAF